MSWFRRRAAVKSPSFVDIAIDNWVSLPPPIVFTCSCGAVSRHPQDCPSVLRFRPGGPVHPPRPFPDVLIDPSLVFKSRLDGLRDLCGVCDLVPTASGYVRGVQVSCPVHGEAKR